MRAGAGTHVEVSCTLAANQKTVMRIAGERRIYANQKSSLNRPQVEAYLAGKRIFPRTVEMDLTTRCTRVCPTCPSAGSSLPAQAVTPGFTDRLLGILEGETHGIILSGGEPTSSPHFVEILRIARRRGFREVAVITNGTELERPEIQNALLDHATAVRVSSYDWYGADVPAPFFFQQLDRVAALRKRVDEEGSALEIGVAMLTSRARLPRLLSAARHAAASGAHWLYFHPMCESWSEGRPVQEDQEGVLDALAALRERTPPGVEVHVPEERYSRYPLEFSAFHSAHFLMQVGADGVNYASPEAKYQKSCALADLNAYMGDDFLWRPERLAAINALSSDAYGFGGTRHRGAMFSDFIERLKLAEPEQTAVAETAREQDFRYPHLC